LGAINRAVFHGNLRDALTGFADRSKPLIPTRRHPDFVEPGLINFTRDVRLEVEALGLRVTLANPAIKFTGHAANRGNVAHIRRAQPARGQPPR